MPPKKKAQPKTKVDNEKNEYIMIIEVRSDGEVILWERYQTLEALQDGLDDIYQEVLADNYSLDNLSITIFKGSVIPIDVKPVPIQVTVPGGNLSIPADLATASWTK